MQAFTVLLGLPIFSQAGQGEELVRQGAAPASEIVRVAKEKTSSKTRTRRTKFSLSHFSRKCRDNINGLTTMGGRSLEGIDRINRNNMGPGT